MISHLKRSTRLIVLIIYLLTTLIMRGAAIDHGISSPSTPSSNRIGIPSRNQEIPIPADGYCLYKSIMLVYLLPVVNDLKTFKKRVIKLVGKEKMISTEESKYDQESDSDGSSNRLWDLSLLQESFFNLRRANLVYCLRQKGFTDFAKDIKQYMEISTPVWASSKEIKKIADQLEVTIQEYTVDPENHDKLIKSDATPPKNKNSSLTLCIVQDNPTQEESVDIAASKDWQIAQSLSAKSSLHRQHYRALFFEIPDSLNSEKLYFTSPISLISSQSYPTVFSQGSLVEPFDPIKDPIGMLHSQEQRNAVAYADMVKQGILEGDRTFLFKGLQKLSTIKIVDVSNPRLVIEKLLVALTCKELEWEAYCIKRYIAKAMRPFIYSMYYVAQKRNKYITSQHKNHLVGAVKNMFGFIKKSQEPSSGLRFELDVIEAMLSSLPDTKNKVDEWKDGVMATMEAVKEKDPRFIFRALEKLYTQMKEKKAKKWYEVVLYIDYIKEIAIENITMLGKLQYLLYFYKEPRWESLEDQDNHQKDLSETWKKKLKDVAANMNLTNPGGDWHILYAGIEALTYVIQHAKGSQLTPQKAIMRKALENIDTKRPGLAYYFDFNELRILGIKASNWRIREKAFESAFLLEEHPNEAIQKKAQQFLENYRYDEEDKRVKLILQPFHQHMVVAVHKALQKDWTSYEKGISKRFSQHETLLRKIQSTLDNNKNFRSKKMEYLLIQKEAKLDLADEIIKNQQNKIQKMILYDKKEAKKYNKKNNKKYTLINIEFNSKEKGELNKKIEQTKEQIDKLNSQLGDQNNKLKKYQNINQSFTEELAKKYQTFNTLQNELQETVKGFNNQLSILHNKLKKDQHSNQSPTEELAKKDEAFSTLQNELQEKVNDFNSQLDDKNNELEEYQNNNQSLTEQLAQKDQAFNTLQNELQEKVNDFTSQLDDKNNELEEYQNNNQSLTEKLAQKDQAFNTLQNELNNKENLIQELRKKAQDLAKQLDEKDQIIKIQNEKIKKMEKIKYDLAGQDLRNRKLPQDLSQYNLRGATLQAIQMKKVKLPRDLTDCNFKSALLIECSLMEAELNGANFQKAKLNDCNLTDANLNGSNFQKAKLTNVKLPNDLSGCKLEWSKLIDCDLANCNFKEARLKGAQLRNVKLPRDLTNFNLEYVTIINCDLTDADLNRINFQKAKLISVKLPKNLSHCNLIDAELSAVSLYSAKLTDCDLTRAKLEKVDLQYAELTNCSLEACDFKGVQLKYAQLRNVKLPKDLADFDLEAVSLIDCNLSKTDLNGANLCFAELNKCELNSADLEHANFEHAKLINCNFTACKLKKVNFQHASLIGCNLTNADLTGANLQYAKLKNVTLPKDLSSCKLKGADLSGQNLTHTNLPRDLRECKLIGAQLPSDLSKYNLTGAILE